MNLRHIFCAPLVCILFAGCGGVKYGKVSGKVTSKGSPLPGGVVTFWPQDAGGGPGGSVIAEDGSYSASVPVGEASVTVETESISGKAKTWLEQQSQPQGKGAAKRGAGGRRMIPPQVLEQIKTGMEEKGNKLPEAVKGNYVKINPMYAKPNSSGFKTTIHSGQQEFNIDLK
jgi:hypothetical protein